MTTAHLVSCGHGHDGLTVCTSCQGTGHVAAGQRGAPDWVPVDLGAKAAGSGDPHCVDCQGTGLLGPHTSCTGSPTS